mgnify:CR=1 FL=1
MIKFNFSKLIKIFKKSINFVIQLSLADCADHAETIYSNLRVISSSRHEQSGRGKRKINPCYLRYLQEAWKVLWRERHFLSM